MARIVPDEKCPFCGEVIAYAKYENVKDGFYGDAFSGMYYTEHECEGLREIRKESRKILNDTLDDFTKTQLPKEPTLKGRK